MAETTLRIMAKIDALGLGDTRIGSLSILSHQVGECQKGVKPLRVEVRPTKPGLKHP